MCGIAPFEALIVTAHDEVLLRLDEGITQAELAEIAGIMTAVGEPDEPLKVDGGVFNEHFQREVEKCGLIIKAPGECIDELSMHAWQY